MRLPTATTALPYGWQVIPLSKLCSEVIDRVDPAAMKGNFGGHYIGLEHVGQGSGQFVGVGTADFALLGSSLAAFLL